MMRDGPPVNEEITPDGAGLVSHPGTALVAQVADGARAHECVVAAVGGPEGGSSGHDPGWVIGDLAVMLADGGECVSDPRRGARRARVVRSGGI